MKRRQFQAGLLALAGGSALGSAHAQSRPGGPGGFPNKPIKLIVPYPAGGIVDAVMRAVSDPLSRRAAAAHPGRQPHRGRRPHRH
jgi:tripartite-type tricarboxylate transporter receptor subunit TctC